MEEEWRPVIGFEGLYEISNLGRVRSLERAARGHAVLVKPSHINRGYLGVSLSKDGVQTRARVHRLVAQAFIPNPHGKKQVNHKNGVQGHNAATNLEWCTNQENTSHARRVLLRGTKAITATSMADGSILEFDSITIAVEAGFTRCCIRRCVLGRWSQYKGYRWALVEPIRSGASNG